MSNKAWPTRRVALALTALLGALGACAPMENQRGYQGDALAARQIEAGVSSRDDVYAALGSPTTRSLYGEEVWYYVGSTTDTVAFFEPEVTERTVIEVRFDPAGYVSDVSTFDATDMAREVNLVDRETPTRGSELTILDQLIGNLGRFSN